MIRPAWMKHRMFIQREIFNRNCLIAVAELSVRTLKAREAGILSVENLNCFHRGRSHRRLDCESFASRRGNGRAIRAHGEDSGNAYAIKSRDVCQSSEADHFEV